MNNPALYQLLRSWLQAGVTELPTCNLQRLQDFESALQLLQPSQTVADGADTTPPAVTPEANKSQTTTPAPATTETNRNLAGGASGQSPEGLLAVLENEVSACQLCQELAQTRTQTVFGVGNPHADLCFMGEAPGADEDRLGEPFVGPAGQLLSKIIEAMGLARNDVYILNTIKCRPPNNRDPQPVEAANCRSFLDRQLAILKPKYICCLGAVAAKNLLQTEMSVGRLRGKFHEYQGIQVVVTYHPAYLLREPSAKRKTWDDVKMLMAAMGLGG